MSSFLDNLPQRYRLILCDLWGCVHDGVRVFPGVAARLDQWAQQDRAVVFLTNAPRPSIAVAEQLARLGLPAIASDAIVSSGSTAIARIQKEDRQGKLAFLGSKADKEWLIKAGLAFGSSTGADALICTGFDERGFSISAYETQLRNMVGLGIEMLCLNPDRLVHRGGQAEPCAGALADLYLQLGGHVRFFGKPLPDIYERAIEGVSTNFRRPLAKSEVLAIGDSISTDFVGAMNVGVDFVFVASGIDKTAYATDKLDIFRRAAKASNPAEPVAIVESLGHHGEQR